MEYAINISYLTKKISMQDAARIVSKAGFTALDYTPPVENNDWKAIMYENLEIFEKEGLKVHQTHAPFNRYNTYGSDYLVFVERAFEATGFMNAEYMVVHGDEFDFENSSYSIEKAISYNYELFAPFVERATNFSLAFENVFQESPQKPRLCSKTEELKELIKSFNSENVCCCWDFGHAYVAFGDKQPDKIRYMDNLIKCTHVHDGGHKKDLHLPPFLGEVDWNACGSALHDIDYSGILSLELVYGAIPEATADIFTETLFKSVSYINTLM